jgi:hypothetical protein
MASRKLGVAWCCVFTVVVTGAATSCRKPSPAQRERSWTLPEEQYQENGSRDPRVQLVWQSPGQDRPGIWSSSLDGQDVRPAVSQDLLFSGEAQTLAETPVRSPNGRYIACSGYSKEKDRVAFLVDRKTRTVKTIMDEPSVDPAFVWSPDSRHVLFFCGSDRWDYDVETGEATKRAYISARQLVFADGGKQIMAVAKEGIEYWDLSGKLLKRETWPYPLSGVDAVSSDGKRALLSSYGHSFVVEVAHPEKRLFERDRSFVAVTFGPDDGSLFYLENGLQRLDYASGKHASLGAFPGHEISDITLTER